MDSTSLYETLFEDEFKARLAEGWHVSTPDQMVTTVVHSAMIRLETVFVAWQSAPLPEVKRRMPLHEYVHRVTVQGSSRGQGSGTGQLGGVFAQIARTHGHL